MKKQIDYFSYIRKYEILIASGGVLMLVIFLIFNLLLPNLNRANQIYAQGQEFRKKLQSLTQKDNILSSIDYAYYKDIFMKSNQILPENKDYVSLVGTFDLLEKQSGVTILRTDFQLGVVSTSSARLVKETGTQAFVIPITIEVMGDFSKVKKFLDLVSDFNGRLMVFDSVSTSTKPGGVLDASFTGRAFFYILPTTLGTIDSSLPALSKNQDTLVKKISQLNLPKETTVEIDKASVGKKSLFE